MTSIRSTATIPGAAEPVFDLVTTARFWPHWHPATQAVGGVTQRPYQLGDQVQERVRFGDRVFVVTWLVAEHVRPARVVLQAQGWSTRIIYTLKSSGAAVEFTRELQYDEQQLVDLFPDPKALENLMQSQSDQGLLRLQELVQKTLREESAGLG
jgi:Polyketide cyclase / dehydrase and lipid transport